MASRSSRFGEHRVDDRRVAGGDDAARLFGGDAINALGYRRRVGVLAKLIGLADPEQRFALDVGAHDDRAGHRADARREVARQP